MILKFAIGEVPAEHAAAVQQEEKEHGSFLRIPIEQVPFQNDLQQCKSDTKHMMSKQCCTELQLERIMALVKLNPHIC